MKEPFKEYICDVCGKRITVDKAMLQWLQKKSDESTLETLVDIHVCCNRKPCDSFFEERGIKPNIILETSDVHLIHQMAESGYALGISLRYLADKIRSDSIKVVRFEENWLVKRLYLVRNKNNVLSVEGELFRNAILDYFQLRRETNISQD